MSSHAGKEFEAVARSDELGEGQLLGVATSAGARICLARVDGRVHAVSDTCPHADFPLSEGVVLPGGVLECVWHGAHFRLETGEVLRGPATDPAKRYEVREEAGRILVGRRQPDRERAGEG